MAFTIVHHIKDSVSGSYSIAVAVDDVSDPNVFLPISLDAYEGQGEHEGSVIVTGVWPSRIADADESESEAAAADDEYVAMQRREVKALIEHALNQHYAEQESTPDIVGMPGEEL